MRAGRVGAVVVAFGALPGCSALLSLDVHYDGDGGVVVAEAGATDATSLDGTAPDSSDGGVVGADANVGDTATGDSPVAWFDGGPPAYVQGNAGFVQVDSRMISVAFEGGVQDHDTIVVAVDYATTPSLGVMDSLGNTYVRAFTPVDNAGTTSAIFYSVDVMGGDDTVMATTPVRIGSFELYIHEYTGIADFDVGLGQNGTGPLMESGFANTTQPNDLLFGFGVTGGASYGAGFTPRLTLNANVTEDAIAGAPGPYETTANTSNNAGWTMLMAAFRPR